MRRAALMTAAACGLLLGAVAQAADAGGDARLLPPRGLGRAGQTDGQPSARGGQRNQAADGGWLTTLGGLTAVLALVFLTAKFLKRKVPAAQQSLPAEVVQVLGRKALDYRHQIHLVRFGSRMLVLGTSHEGIRTLSEITDPVEIDVLAGLCKTSEKASIAGSFRRLFQGLQGREPARYDTDPEAAGEPPEQQQERSQDSQERQDG